MATFLAPMLALKFWLARVQSCRTDAFCLAAGFSCFLSLWRGAIGRGFHVAESQCTPGGKKTLTFNGIRQTDSDSVLQTAILKNQSPTLRIFLCIYKV